MRIVFFIIFLFPFTSDAILYGQSQFYKPLNNKDREKFISAKTAHKQKKIDQALKLYCKLLDKYSGNPEVELWTGLAYKDKGNNLEALPHLIKATEQGKSDNALLYSTIGEIYKKEKNYESSRDYYGYFLDHSDSTSSNYTKGKKLYDQMEFASDQVKNPVPFDPIPLDYNVNTLNSEYLPQFTADHKTLFFTRRNRHQEDIYIVEQRDSVFSESFPFRLINTDQYDEGAHTISADGTTFIYTHNNDKMGIGGYDLYYTKKTSDGWSKPKNMGARINSILWESQPSLSGDGRILFFSSTRDGGEGGKDIWYTVLGNSGIWSLPKNAGPTINTSDDESSPFLHADLRTLYFRSKGHLGMGDYDLFFSKRNKNGVWSEVKNLGYPINTEGQEGALTVSLDGTKGYFATDFDGESIRNNLDIYQFDLPYEIRPEPCTYIKIQSIDANTKIPVNSNLELIDINSNTLITSKRTNMNGEVLVPVPLKKAIMINVVSDGYLFFSDNLILDTISHGMSPYHKIVELDPLPSAIEPDSERKSFVLKNIFFESGTSELKEISYKELKRISNILKDKPELNLRITGHTDSVGSDIDNMKLFKKPGGISKECNDFTRC